MKLHTNELIHWTIIRRSLDARKKPTLFYNYILHSFVIIDLKLTPFKPEYLGKMMFYINVANDTLKGENDNPTIGLILFKEAENIVMKYSFGNMITPVKVAEYKFIEELPEYLEKRLKAISLNIK